MATSESGSTTRNDTVFVGECNEGNCSWRMEHDDEAYVNRMAGRHEGAEDLQHTVDVEVDHRD